MDGTHFNNIFEKEFGDKKKPAEQKKSSPPPQEETITGNVFAETFGGVKKKESTPTVRTTIPEVSSPLAKAATDIGGVSKTGSTNISGEESTEEVGDVEISSGSFQATPSTKGGLTGLFGRATKQLKEKTGYEEQIGKPRAKIQSGEGELKDFAAIYEKSPDEFEMLKTSLNIPRSKEDAGGDKFKDENYVYEVFSDYKDKVTESKLEYARTNRGNIAVDVQNNLPVVSEFTGVTYDPPKNLGEAQKIINDINGKRQQLEYLARNTDGSVSDKIAQIRQMNEEVEKATAVMPALTKLVGGFVFDEVSKTNPNTTPFEVGLKIFEATDPQSYKLYKEAGGDRSIANPGNRDREDTPKKADAINRYITQLGIQAFNTFGNKKAIEAAEVESRSLGWKFTGPVEEETKHMIAAQLLREGIKPNRATDEQKDAVAETLPETYRDTWFGANKENNNVSLPSTGLGYSTKNAYRHTVEDATKQLLGWVMPGRGRERALDVLESQGTSNLVGENPESKARLNALEQKEKTGKLTADEVAEKQELEKYTDVRTNWQKFKDLSGSGVGQFAGFGTISAFTGGLGNARNIGGAAKALISPAAGRNGMLAAGYLMSREQNARDAVQMFPGEDEGLKRFAYGEVASAIDTFIERLFPEERFLSGILKKETAQLIPNLTAKNLRKELNEGLASKIAKTVVAKVAEQQKTPIQEGLEETIAAGLKDTFHGILDPDRDAMTIEDLLEVGTQAYLSTQLLGVPKGVMAQRNRTVPLNAIWDAASSPADFFGVKHKILEMKANGDLTDDEANERISHLNTAKKFYEDNPVLSGNMGALSLPKRQNYLGRLMNEAVLEKQAESTTDENVRATYNKEIAESKKARKAIYDGDVEVTERNDEKNVPREIKAENDQWKANIQAIVENEALTDAEKETAKQAEDERHAKQIAQLETDATLLESIKKGKRVSPDEQKEELQYFVDKVGEAPAAATERYGAEAVKELLPRVPTETLKKNYDLLAKIDASNPDAVALDEELAAREEAEQELTKEEEKDWNELSLEEKRELAAANLPEVIDTTEEDEIVQLANDNAKYLLAKLRGEDISRPVVLNPKLPGEKTEPKPAEEKGSATIPVEGKEPLTQEAVDLLESIGSGSKPTFITKNLERIAKENGIVVDDTMTADDIINQLKEKNTQNGKSKKDRSKESGGTQKRNKNTNEQSKDGGEDSSGRTTSKPDSAGVTDEGGSSGNTRAGAAASSGGTSATAGATDTGGSAATGGTTPTADAGGTTSSSTDPATTTEQKTEPVQPVLNEGDGPPPSNFIVEETEDDGVGITHADTEVVREQYNLGQYEKAEAENVPEWDRIAAERIVAEGIEPTMEKLRRGGIADKIEQRMMLQYVAHLDKQASIDPSDENLAKLKDAIELADRIAGSEWGKAGAARKGRRAADDSLASWFIREMEEEAVDILTPGQKKTVEKEWEEINKAKKEFQEWTQKKEEEFNEREAGLAVEEMKKKRGKRSQDLKKEREVIIGDILAKLTDDKNVSFFGAGKIAEIAPDVLKLARNLFESGAVKLADLTDQLYTALQEKVSKKEINAILAGRYNERKPTKSELTIRWTDLKEEAKLIDRLDALERGEIPKNTKKQEERNREIKALRDQIKNHDLTQLGQAKTRIKAQIEKIDNQLKTGDFAPPIKPKIELDEEGERLHKKLIEKRKAREIRILKSKYEKRDWKKRRLDQIAKIANVPRSLMASMDFSAPLNQAAIATTAYPKLAAAAAKQMLRAAKSQYDFDKWFEGLKEDPNYELMKETGLRISDPDSPYLTAHEEQFMSGYAERISGVGKLIKGSERAYVQYLNKMRVDLFNKYIGKYESDGKSYEKNKKLYDKTARYINNITGAGDLGSLDQYAPVFSALLFSPRLMASRIRLLSPLYWGTLPWAIQKKLIRDMGIYVGVRASILGGLSLYSRMRHDDDDDKRLRVETDPRSSDYGKVRQGNTRWDMWGGFQPYIRLAAQLKTGQRKTTTMGDIQEINEGKAGLSFIRGKAAPVPAMIMDLLAGENVVGEPVTVKSMLFRNLPLSIQSAWEGISEQGYFTPLSVLAPSGLGIGVQTYEPREKEIKKEITYSKKVNGKSTEFKVTLTDDQFKDYETRARKYVKEEVKELEADKEYQALNANEKAALKRRIENAAVTKAKKQIEEKYKSSFKISEKEQEKAESKKRMDKIIKKLED